MNQKDDPADRIAQIAGEVISDILVRILPRRIASIISECYAGQRIPKGTAAKRAIRNGHIRDQAAAGRTPNELAVAFNLTPGQIKRILKHYEHRDRKSD